METTHTLPENLLKFTLWLLALYFALIAVAHITQLKLPLLFVYYNVPSETYQDNIIAFMAFGWAVLFATIARHASQNLAFIRAILIVASGAIAGLSYNNLTTDFTVFSESIPVWPFWAQTGILASIALWLLGLYVAVSKGR